MNLKSQWIFTQLQLKQINKIRTSKYAQLELERVNQHLIIKAQLSKFIFFMRSRKRQIDYPLKFEKVIYLAVALYRRYYLLNIYLQEEAVRNLISAVYVSLKLNEYDEGFIIKMALKWKQKPVFCPTRRFPHFGEEGYTQAELTFLAGVRFQTTLSKLIQPVQAMYEQINQVYRQKLPFDHQLKLKSVDFLEILPQIFTQLDRVYYHPFLMFIYEGPKLALAVMIAAIKRKNFSLSIMGDHLRLLAEECLDQVERIIIELDLQDSNQTHDLAKMKLPKFKKPDPKKLQSPRFQGRSDTYPPIND